ncbi:hypothetical protein MN202_09990 [Rheinheimera muenzenbergensis]|uniref:Uncharacterized protein n=1 Tax=Rheinheimera muenzenbergensis TaxID=1193628 RepID=A0ABU8C6K8_9GAMM
MDPITHWKQIITQANKAFAHDHFALAAGLYQHAAGVMTDAWPDYVENQQQLSQQQWQDSVVQLVLCYSISVQNLAETYARQQRWRRCLSVLRQTLSQLQRLLQQLPGSHPASIAVLRESCHIRREFCRFSQQHQAAHQHSLSVAPYPAAAHGWLH